MKISTILANVEQLRTADVSDTPEGFAERYDSRRRDKELSKLDTNPRRELNKFEGQSRDIKPFPEGTLVGKK